MEINTYELNSMLRELVDLYGDMFAFPEMDDKNIEDTYTKEYENVKECIEALHEAIVALLEEQ